MHYKNVTDNVFLAEILALSIVIKMLLEKYNVWHDIEIWEIFLSPAVFCVFWGCAAGTLKFSSYTRP